MANAVRAFKRTRIPTRTKVAINNCTVQGIAYEYKFMHRRFSHICALRGLHMHGPIDMNASLHTKQPSEPLSDPIFIFVGAGILSSCEESFFAID